MALVITGSLFMKTFNIVFFLLIGAWSSSSFSSDIFNEAFPRSEYERSPAGAVMNALGGAAQMGTGFTEALIAANLIVSSDTEKSTKVKLKKNPLLKAGAGLMAVDGMSRVLLTYGERDAGFSPVIDVSLRSLSKANNALDSGYKNYTSEVLR